MKGISKNRNFSRVGFSCLGLIVGSLFMGNVIYSDDSQKRILNTCRAALHDELFLFATDLLEQTLQGSQEGSFRASTVELLAQSYFGEKRFQDVIDLLKKNKSLMDQYPSSRSAFLFWQAAAWFELEETDKAELLLQTTTPVDDPYKKRMQRLKIRLYLKTGDFDKALFAYRQCSNMLDTLHNVPHELLDWATIQLSLEKNPEAEELLATLANNKQYSPYIRAEASYWLGRIYMRQEKLEDALNLLKNLISHEGSYQTLNDKAWLALADIYVEQGVKTNAISALTNTTFYSSFTEQSSELRASLTRMLIDIGHFEEAEKLLREEISRQGSNPELGNILLYLADMEYIKERISSALKTYQEYLGVFLSKPGRAHAFYGKGWCLISQKRYEEAITCFEKSEKLSIDKDKKNACQHKIADIFFLQEQYEQAQEKYINLIRSHAEDKRYPQYLFQVALCQVKQEAFDEAFSTLKEIKTRFPASPVAERAMIQQALIHEQKRQWSDAIKIYEEHLTLYTNGNYTAKAILLKGRAQYRLGLFSDASNSFDLLSRQLPEHPLNARAMYLKGWSAYLNGEEEEALKIFTLFKEKYPDSKWGEHVLFSEAEYFYNQGEYKKALEKYNEIILRYPKGTLKEKALLSAGRASFKRKEYTEAIDFFKTMVEKYPQSAFLPEALFGQGDALTSLGEFSGAILLFERIIKEYPESYLYYPAWGRMGDCHYTLGEETPERYEDALKAYQTMLESETCPIDLALQARYKIARTLENMNKEDSWEQYQHVLYDFISHRDELGRNSSVWFTRAGFTLAERFEKQKAWRKAINIYKRVAESSVPASEEAENRIKKIQEEQAIQDL